MIVRQLFSVIDIQKIVIVSETCQVLKTWRFRAGNDFSEKNFQNQLIKDKITRDLANSFPFSLVPFSFFL
ncbi:hypothetical protein BGP_0290 [Beggiatoa sp. PS]|nr:hypothetical protein BGP_0290 [Beggiatoa sp. PS]